MQDALDEMYAGVERLLVAEAIDATPARGATVLDVGCGTGATTVAVADALAAPAAVTGVDLSEPMIRAARERAAATGSAARFTVADAARHGFDPGAADLIVSRFGVMFFDDPVAAFANLRAAARPGAALRAVVWRDPAENPFMTAAEHAAVGLVDLPPRRVDTPGQFGLADRERTVGLLEQAGWRAVTARPVDVACAFPAADLPAYLTSMGPVGRALADAPPARVAQVLEAVRPAFDRFVDGDRVRFTAACRVLSATA